MHDRDPSVHNAQLTSDDPGPSGGAVSTGAASRLVAACENAWRALQRHHPEIPDAVIVLGTGVERGRLVKLGHWWGGQWVVEEGRRAEVLLAGEALHLSPDAVFEVLVHEAAHGVNATRGVKDTSRGGRYHNAHFKSTAEALGLTVTRQDRNGWATTTLSPEARERHAQTIAAIAAEMRLARHVPPPPAPTGVQAGQDGPGVGVGGGGDGKGRSSGQAVTATCGCGRRLRMAPSVLAAGPITCGRCRAEFTASRQVQAEATTAPPDENPRPAAGVVDRSFLARRQQAVAAEAGAADYYEQGVRNLERFEEALVALAARGDDPETVRMLEVFPAQKGALMAWVDGISTADVVPLPVDRQEHRRSPAPRGLPTRSTDEIDLRSIDLPLPTPTPHPDTAMRRNMPEVEL